MLMFGSCFTKSIDFKPKVLLMATCGNLLASLWPPHFMSRAPKGTRPLKALHWLGIANSAAAAAQGLHTAQCEKRRSTAASKKQGIRRSALLEASSLGPTARSEVQPPRSSGSSPPTVSCPKIRGPESHRCGLRGILPQPPHPTPSNRIELQPQ